jgi:NAD(P)-dependent dehydrogenase (short-subunit alcohol dehydrogenase family)
VKEKRMAGELNGKTAFITGSGRGLGRVALRDFVSALPIPAADRQRLLELDPASYTGLAAELARRI